MRRFIAISVCVVTAALVGACSGGEDHEHVMGNMDANDMDANKDGGMDMGTDMGADMGTDMGGDTMMDTPMMDAPMDTAMMDAKDAMMD